MKENYFLDDGAFLIAKILIKMSKLRRDGKHIDELISGLEEPYESKEYRMNLLCEDFKDYGTEIIEKLTEYAKTVTGWTVEPENYEGVRVSCDKERGDGWFLLRLSLHDPLMPLNIESNIQGGVEKIVSQLKPCLKQFDKLDTSVF